MHDMNSKFKSCICYSLSNKYSHIYIIDIVCEYTLISNI